MGNRNLGPAAIVGLVAALAAGCSPTGSEPATSCQDIPEGACGVQITAAKARHPEATMIDVVCTDTCRRDAGSVLVTWTLPGGKRIKEPITYAFVVPPVPEPTCDGLPAKVCAEVVRQAVDAQSPEKDISRIDARCGAPPCTDHSGRADVLVTFTDGSTAPWGMGLGGGL